MIELPMLETLASFWLTEHLFGATWKPERGAMGYDRIINKFRHPFPTKNGYICALPYTDQHWITFFELAGRPDSRRKSVSSTAWNAPNASANSTRCSTRS
jgi:formyl-CoA transferase